LCYISKLDVLPSANLRVHLSDDLFLRFAGSETMTRPDFSSMNPNTTLVLGSLSGSKGNINLPPMYSDNVDASLEYYFSKGSSVYVAGFSKWVRNFPYSASQYETIGGVQYTISETLSSPKGGTIRGAEIGYTQFYDFLPGAWGGLGMQANYTYVDSSQPYYLGSGTGAYLAAKTTLPNLSRHNFTLIGMYEYGPISARLAYTWRSAFLQSLYAGSGILGIVPLREAGYGWMDASITYNCTDEFAVVLQAGNLLDTMQHTFYNSAPLNYWINDRSFMIGLRYRT
jgi:TonB-dependent receptor